MTAKEVVRQSLKRYALVYCIVYAIFRIVLPAWTLDLCVATALGIAFAIIYVESRFFDVGSLKGNLLISAGLFLPIAPVYVLDQLRIYEGMEVISFVLSMILGAVFLLLFLRPEKIRF